MKVDELLRLACVYAVQDRESFIHAVRKDADEVTKQSAYLKELKAYMRKRWPGKGELEALMEDAKPMSITEIMARSTVETVVLA